MASLPRYPGHGDTEERENERRETDRENENGSRPTEQEGAISRSVSPLFLPVLRVIGPWLRGWSAYCFSPQKGQLSDRAWSGLRQCQQKVFFGTSRALSRFRMSSISVALWSISPAVVRSSASSEARW